MIEVETKWLHFNLLDATGKTKRWQVVTNTGEEVLGSVHWFGRWRQYAFFPLDGTIYERQCLRDIANFCEQQTQLWREAKKQEGK